MFPGPSTPTWCLGPAAPFSFCFIGSFGSFQEGENQVWWIWSLCSTAVCSYSPPWVSQVIFLALWPGMWFSLSWFLETDRQTVQSPELALQWCDTDSEVFKHSAIRLASTTLEADLQPCVEKRLYWRLPRGWGRKLNQTNLHCTAAMLPRFHTFLLKCGHYLLGGAMLFTKQHSVIH